MLSLLPSSEYGLVVCVRAGIVRVSVGFVGHISHVFHYWWDGLFVPAATWGFAFSFVGFARNLLRRLTREWVVCFGG